MTTRIDDLKAMVIDRAHCLFDNDSTAIEHSKEYYEKIASGLTVIYTARPEA